MIVTLDTHLSIDAYNLVFEKDQNTQKPYLFYFLNLDNRLKYLKIFEIVKK